MSDNKFSTFELGSFGLNSKGSTIIYVGEVLSTDDPLNAGRIKVRVLPFDKDSVLFCKEKKGNGGSKTKYYKSQGNNSLSSTSTGSLTEITNPTTVKNLNSGANNRDTSTSDTNCTEIPWSIPLDQSISMSPKVGEMVKIILFDSQKPQLNRVWVGPMISQPNKVNYDDMRTAGGALNTASIPITTNKTNPLKKDKNKNINYFPTVFPKKEDLTIYSRNNADIVMPTFGLKNDNVTRNGEIMLRAGKFKFNNNPQKNGMILNDENIAYFRIKVLNVDDSDIKDNGTVEKQPPTHSMLFSDYISIVSHKNGEEGSEEVSKINPIINTDDEIIDVHNSLSPLIRGDKLVSFLELLVDYIKSHNHNYHGIPATDANSKPEIENFDLQSLLSTNIRIN
jgi:hypothetical protein